jgi:hypothetical protein
MNYLALAHLSLPWRDRIEVDDAIGHSVVGAEDMMSRQHGKREDPANDVVQELYNEISADLGTDGPAETFGHPDENVVGRLVEEDEGAHPDVTAEALATDSHDTSDLSAEEAAIHLVRED